MPKHYDVHLVKIIHVVVDNDAPDPEWAAVDTAMQEFVNEMDQPGGVDMSHDFWATDREDVYPVEPCDCQS